MLHSISRFVVLTSALAACGSRASVAEAPAAETSQPFSGALPSSALPAGPCEVSQRSDLPGVVLQLQGVRCNFTLAEAAAGIVFPYELIVEQSVSDVTSPPADDGGCGGKKVGGLEILETVSGPEHRFCECDFGDCLPDEARAFTLEAGQTQGEFKWPGVSWNGESDTMSPYGDAFVAGTYQVEVLATGHRLTPAGEVSFHVATVLEISLAE